MGRLNRNNSLQDRPAFRLRGLVAVIALAFHVLAGVFAATAASAMSSPYDGMLGVICSVADHQSGDNPAPASGHPSHDLCCLATCAAGSAAAPAIVATTTPLNAPLAFSDVRPVFTPGDTVPHSLRAGPISARGPPLI